MFACFLVGTTSQKLIIQLRECAIIAQCDQCGQHVTPDSHRVFADNEGALHGCPACLSATAIKNGEATGR